MNSYEAHLSHQAQVPENQSLEAHFKQSIEFNILCPVSGCKEIKANGFDYKFRDPVQTYKCKIHNRRFYAHTSWLMVQLAEIVIQRVLLAVFNSSVPNFAIAERYKLSESTLSKLVVNCENYVDYIISKINEDKERYGNLKLPKLLETVFWIDETFFKVGKKSWALILAVDYNGRVLGWKFGKTRKASDIEEVMKMVGQKMPNWELIIADGARTYAKGIRSFQKTAYLIQQFHSHPWQKAKITEFTKISKNMMREDIIEIDYRAFEDEDPQIGHAIRREKSIKVSPKKRGRKKGQKNGTGKKKIIKEEKSKRGPKSARKSGRSFQFGHTTNHLEVGWIDDKPENVKIPDKEVIERLLHTTSMIFSNKCIQSNRIESVNSEIKQIIPHRGMQNKKHLENRVERCIQLKNRDNEETSLQMSLPISSKLGFNNINLFFDPKPCQITLKKEVRII